MTTHTISTYCRNVTRMTLGAIGILVIVGIASIFASATINGAPSAAGDSNVTLAVSPAPVTHYEPFLGAPRWTGSWSRSH